MIEPEIVTILIIASLVVISIFSSVLSFRMGAPLLLVFLGVGLLAGEDGIGGIDFDDAQIAYWGCSCLLYTSPSPRDLSTSRMPSSA